MGFLFIRRRIVRGFSRKSFWVSRTRRENMLLDRRLLREYSPICRFRSPSLDGSDTHRNDDSPTLILPPLLMTVLERRGAFAGPTGPRRQTLAHLALIGSALLIFLPPAIAVFPQRASIDPKKLEERFWKSGYEKVEFNKGL